MPLRTDGWDTVLEAGKGVMAPTGASGAGSAEPVFNDKKCRAGKCTKLIQYKIDPAKCKGCTLCARKCPANAITGTVKQPHVIDQSKCIKCGQCEQNCKFDAISHG